MRIFLCLILIFSMTNGFAMSSKDYAKLLSELTPREKKLREQDLLVLKTFGIIVGKFDRAAKIFEIRIAGEEEVGPIYAAAENLEKATEEVGLAAKMNANPESFEESPLELKGNLELTARPAAAKK